MRMPDRRWVFQQGFLRVETAKLVGTLLATGAVATALFWKQGWLGDTWGMIGTLALIAAAGFVGLRTRIVIDPATREVHCSRDFYGFALRPELRSLGSFRGVVVSVHQDRQPESTPSSGPPYMPAPKRFEVELDQEEDPLFLARFGEREPAEQLAVDLARDLGLPVSRSGYVVQALNDMLDPAYPSPEGIRDVLEPLPPPRGR